MAKYIMALDQGTTSSRCILFDKAGNICSMAQREFEQIYPKPGWVEHNPMEIWSTQYAVMSEAMALLGAKPNDIAGIGITNQRETTIVWDKETGEPVYNAIVWQCRRTAKDINLLVKDGYADEEIEELDEASALKDISHMPARVKCAVLGWHTLDEALNKE